MKLILRNQLVKSTHTEGSSSRSPKTFVTVALAAVVSGVNYYFQNFVADK